MRVHDANCLNKDGTCNMPKEVPPEVLTWEDEGGSWEFDIEESPKYNDEHEDLHEMPTNQE